MFRFTLVVTLAALAGCQCRQSDKPADPTPATPPARPAAVLREPRSCQSLDACLSACDGGVSSGCYDAALFLFEQRLDAGRDLSSIPSLTSLACDQGDGRGCLRSQRLDDAARLLPAQCDGGSAESCELWFTLAQQLDAGSTAADAASRTHALLEKSCQTGNQQWACARLGSVLSRGRLGVTDVKRGVALLETACDAGVAGACLEATLIFSRGLPGFEPDAARAAKTGRRARELSEAAR